MIRGEVAIAGRVGRERLWDLAERVYPDDDPVPYDEALRLRGERRLRALGIARARATEIPNEPNSVGEAGEPTVVDGVKGEWRVDPAYLGDGFDGRTEARARRSQRQPLRRKVAHVPVSASIVGAGSGASGSCCSGARSTSAPVKRSHTFRADLSIFSTAAAGTTWWVS